MPNRRDFLKSVAGATLSLQAVPTAKRREVFIGKRRVKVVDIHGHFVAPEELDVVKKLGLRGVGIAGHAGGEVPSTPKYDPFWTKVQELGVMVFVHPGGADNIIKENALRGRGDLGNIIGNPLETTFFLSRLILDGTLDRFPGV